MSRVAVIAVLWYDYAYFEGMMDVFKSSIEEALKGAGIEYIGEFSTPPKPEMGDVAIPCFEIAKRSGRNPGEIAKELAEQIKAKLDTASAIAEVRVFGPYLNFFFKPDALAKTIIDQALKPAKKNRKTAGSQVIRVMIESPSNNTHKEFHIGHFRNASIGMVLVNLYDNAGYQAYPVNYLNDFGAHVAKCLWGLKKFHGKEKPPKNKQKWLGEIYAEASRYLKDHLESADEVADIQKQLEAGDKKIWSLFLKTRKWSIEKFNEIFKELKLKHVAVFYEKDLKADGQKMVDKLLEKGIAKVGEGGAIIVDLTEYKLDIALVRKSNGVGLYLTSDLPLAERKFKKIPVDESIVITGEEQKFYFKQLYKILELLGDKRRHTHISYGLINLPEGKMSSRAGNVILYEDLRDRVITKMSEETAKRHVEWSKKKIAEISKKLAFAALKFDVLKHEAAKNIIFDINEATSFEGFSGPYILYTVARINSLEVKAKKAKIGSAKDLSVLSTAEEKELLFKIGEMSEMLKKALLNYNPSVVARYAFELAQVFNNFYNKQKVVGAETKELAAARLLLCLASRQTLINLLGILSIDPVKEM